MVKIEVQEDQKYWNDYMVFIWYKMIQYRNYVKNEFNVVKYYYSFKQYTEDLVFVINVIDIFFYLIKIVFL